MKNYNKTKMFTKDLYKKINQLNTSYVFFFRNKNTIEIKKYKLISSHVSLAYSLKSIFKIVVIPAYDYSYFNVVFFKSEDNCVFKILKMQSPENGIFNVLQH